MFKARIKNNMCSNAHPVGCFYQVYEQIEQARGKRVSLKGKTALVVGCSSGIGLASRIGLTFSAGMDTLGIYTDRAAQPHKMGSAGWYNNQAFEYYARRANKLALSSNQDAFQVNAKEWIVQKLQQQEKKLDVLVYSVAAPKRTVKGVGEYRSVIKPIAKGFDGIAMDPFKEEMRDIHIEAASRDEIEATVKVMGGEDWQEWVNYLKGAGVLADDFITVAYSYLGPEHTQAIYGEGTLGAAKAHLHETAIALQQNLKSINGRAHIGLFPALVTPSSAVIPSMPLYISLLHEIQKEKGLYETTQEQVLRLFDEHLSRADAETKLRVDDRERRTDVQLLVAQRMAEVEKQGIAGLPALVGFRQRFLNQFGFGYDHVQYDEKPDPLTPPALFDFDQPVAISKAG